MIWLRYSWVWLKDHLTAILGGLVLVLGAYLLWRRQQGQIASLSDALAVERARRDVAALQERRRSLMAQADEKSAEVAAVDAQLVANQRAAVEAATRVQGMSDAEVASEFARMGF